MGRGRGKGRKLNGSVNHEDCGSGEEEKIPAQKKRGRPLKHLKEEVVNKTEKGDRNDDSSYGIGVKDKSQLDVLKKRKMKYESKDEEKSELVKEESGNETNKSSSIDEELVKPSDFGQNSRRRKNKPCRAAEAVVECS